MVTATTRQKSESGLRLRPGWRDRSENCSLTHARQHGAKINIVPEVGRGDMGCAASRARVGSFLHQRAGKIYRDQPKSGTFTVNFLAHPTLRTLHHFTPHFCTFLNIAWSETLLYACRIFITHVTTCGRCFTGECCRRVTVLVHPPSPTQTSGGFRFRPAQLCNFSDISI